MSTVLRCGSDKYLQREYSPFQLKDGSYGIPVTAFRVALIRAAEEMDYYRPLAAISIFVVADGNDAVDGIPLVRITKGVPYLHEFTVRFSSRVVGKALRPTFRAGWRAKVTVRFDTNVFSAREIKAILRRAGQRVAVGCHGVSSPVGSLGWGTFKLRRA